MSPNRLRDAANAVLVLLLAALAAALLAGIALPAATLALLIAGAALAGAAARLMARGPDRDELVIDTERRSVAFGYWATLWTFLAFFLAARLGWIAPGAAFFALAVVIAGAPPLYMLVASARGRAG